MEKLRVQELKAMAKERGLKGYSKLRKAELIQRLQIGEVPIVQIPSIMNTVINDYVKPTLIEVKKAFDWTKNKAMDLGDFINKNLNDRIDWAKKPSVQPSVPREKPSLSDYVKEELKERAAFELKESKSALKKFAIQYKIDGKDGYDPESFLKAVKPSIVSLLGKNRSIKVKLVLSCTMEKTNPATGKSVTRDASFHSKIEIILQSTDMDDLYNTMVDRVLESMTTFQKQGSNWTFKSIINLGIHTVKYEPLKGSSYIPLPKNLMLKKAIINLKNEDDECFKWCVTRALNQVEDHPERITKELREQSGQFNWANIKFPTDLKTIDRFERQNATISINVLGYEESIDPLRISKYEHENVINLLLISDGERQHYCLIKNMSKLLSAQTSKKKVGHLFCLRCLNSFTSQESLSKHKEYCNTNEAVKIELPEKGTTLTFKNFNRSMRVPFVVYADFESFTEKINTSQPNPDSSYTNQYQKHTPSGFCYHIECFDDKIYYQEPVIYTKQREDEDIGQIFVDTLEQNITDIYNKFKFPKKMIFDQGDKDIFDNTKHCHICNGEFEELGEDNKKVRDHCHLSGKFRGAAHNKCNLQYKIPKFFPVIFHNLSGYDSHLFIKNLGVTEGPISCIPTNEEKYISFTKQIVVDSFTNKEGKEVVVNRELRFIDSFKFMASSLDSLVNNLDNFNILKQFYEGNQLDLLLRKGVYPYDHMDSLEKLDETQLPPKEAFYSKLSDEDISEKDYIHAQNVWEKFNMKTMREYHDLYLKTDVLLLADVFENFRDVCLENYALDPAWYYTAPGLAWGAALKLTEVNLELLSDPDMLLMFEKGIRGGVSTIMTRHGKANNPYMNEKYDSAKPTKYIAYLDANNLYGWAMSKPLPTHGFEWMSEGELKDWKNGSCILEVDLEYPEHLHDEHNDYPLAPERLMINKVEKLIPNLNNKTKYIVHYENLKLYESLGLKITKIHRGLKFEESAWLKKYIDLNTNLRSKAKNDFEKDFFKLMNNSVFGKTMENIRTRVDIRLVNSEKKARKLSSKPNYDHCTIFDKNLIAIHMKKTKLKFNKPVYLGMCILDLSKTLMYDFHYHYVKNKYADSAKLLFTDTDSLAYEIETEDFYKDINIDVEQMFDTSNFPADHPSGIRSGVNKKVVGMFKDEAGGKIMEEFVGLRAKLYSYKMYEDGKEEKKCKGVKRSVVKNNISFDDYKKCLFGGGEQIRKMNVIRSHGHEIYTEEVNKVALSRDDDKRIILEDGIHTLAYGHYKKRLYIKNGQLYCSRRCNSTK